jgi:surface antigen
MLKRLRVGLGSAVLSALLALTPIASATADQYWQCVPFARLTSGIQIFGDAWTWWQQASNRYEKGFTPKAGAVLCFKPVGAMRLGHVAVVSQVLTDRVIQITHANWSIIGGTRGKIERDVTVVDVSPAGDWSKVKVWYNPIRDLGTTTYPTYGFIYQNPTTGAGTSAFAQAQTVALAAAQGAATQVASSIRPGGSPLSALTDQAEATDRIASLIQSALGQSQ